MARIIYAEGDELVGQLVQQVLGKAGHAVGVIHHGTLAFDTIAFKKPDLVILDQALPGIQGLGILRALRRLPALHRTPILVLSAESGEAAAAEAIGAGATDHLAKPLDPAALAVRVAEMLRRSDLRHEASV